MISRLQTMLTTCCIEPSRFYSNPNFEQAQYYTLKLSPPNELDVGGKIVTKLFLGIKIFERMNDSVLQITFADKTKISYGIKSDKIWNCIHLFTEYQAKMRLFSPSTNALAWSNTSMNQLYQDNVDYEPAKTYERLHRLLVDKILALNLRKANVIEGGCGIANFLKLLEPSAKSYRLLGFDFNQANIDDAYGNDASDNKYQGNAKFIQGNLLNIGNIINEYKANHFFDSTNPTILVLSGSLTRHVLNNGFEAVQILQRAALSQVDYFIGGGQSLPLITDYIAKRIGYKSIDNSLESHERGHLFLYEKMLPTEILQNKIKKIRTRQELDLSLSPDPLYLLTTLQQDGQLQDGLAINLSYCEINAEKLEKMMAILKNYPHTKLIFWHWDKQVLQLFTSVVEKQSFQYEIRQSYDDWFLTAPRHFFTALNILDMPTELDHTITEEDIKYFVITNNNDGIQAVLAANDENNMRSLFIEAIDSENAELIAKILVLRPQLLNQRAHVEHLSLESYKIILTFLIQKSAYNALYDVISTYSKTDFPFAELISILKNHKVDLIRIASHIKPTTNNFLQILLHVRRNYFIASDYVFLQEVAMQYLNSSSENPLAMQYKILRLAIEQIQEETFTGKLLQKIDIQQLDEKKQNFLHQAVVSNNLIMTNYLANHFSYLINQVDSAGNTPLLCVTAHSYYPNIDLAIALLKNGADISIRDAKGNTLLHSLAEYGQHLPTEILEIAQLINPMIFQTKNNDGKTVIDLAVGNKNGIATNWLSKNHYLDPFITKSSRPAPLKLFDTEVVPQGEFGNITAVEFAAHTKGIFSIVIHFSGAFESFPPSMAAYLSHSLFSDIKLNFDASTKTIKVVSSDYGYLEDETEEHPVTRYKTDLSENPFVITSGTDEHDFDGLAERQIDTVLSLLHRVNALPTVNDINKLKAKWQTLTEMLTKEQTIKPKNT